jgi:hypothetical protein
MSPAGGGSTSIIKFFQIGVDKSRIELQKVQESDTTKA